MVAAVRVSRWVFAVAALQLPVLLATASRTATSVTSSTSSSPGRIPRCHPDQPPWCPLLLGRCTQSRHLCSGLTYPRTTARSGDEGPGGFNSCRCPSLHSARHPPPPPTSMAASGSSLTSSGRANHVQRADVSPAVRSPFVQDRPIPRGSCMDGGTRRSSCVRPVSGLRLVVSSAVVAALVALVAAASVSAADAHALGVRIVSLAGHVTQVASST